MDPRTHHRWLVSRRSFLSQSAAGLGGVALAAMLGESASGAAAHADGPGTLPHFAPCAKRVIYLFQSGAPSQMDLFDYKPQLANDQGKELPDSVRMGQRLTGMTSRQTSFPIAGSKYRFAQHGKAALG